MNRRIRCVLVILALLPCAQAEVLVCLGDSITAGYGLDEKQAYPALLGAKMKERHPAWKVVNGGVSGDTTAGGLARLDWVLKAKPTLVLVALGGNDGLRALPVDRSATNLARIIEQLQAKKVRVALAGMRMPPSLGQDYISRFAAMYPLLAKEHQVPLYPFLLEGVAAVPEFNQPDMIHPNAKGQQVIADRLWTFIEPLLTP